MVQAGIQTKFISILALAAVAPGEVGVLSIRVFGVRHYEQGQGLLYQTMAEYVAEELALLVRHEAESMRDWARDFGLAERVLALATPRPFPADASGPTGTADQAWSQRTPADPGLAAAVHNPVAEQLRQFRSVHPQFAELLVTDAQGRLVAATNKTTDYAQADEEWWGQAMGLGPGSIGADGIHLDPSAQVYSIDLAMPVFAGPEGGDGPVGVLKGVLHALPLFTSLPPKRARDQPSTLVTLGDGRIFARLFQRTGTPLQESLPPNVVTTLFQEPAGWKVSRMGSAADPHLFGYAELHLASEGLPHVIDAGVTPMFVVLHRNRALVNAPMTLQALLLYFSGAILVVVFILVGLHIAEEKIVTPLQILQTAAQAISSTAGLSRPGEEAPRQPTLARRETAEAMAARVRSIQTGDEIEELARDFSLMAGRVMQYHDELEREIALRVQEIENDQRVAREFQQALLPNTYPDIPERGLAAAFRVRFHHIYEPTLAVGGDFFHVAKISPHQVRVFIADVMGHGARSALITAILRTLLEDLAPFSKDPADLLRLINRRFCSSLPRLDECIFATACVVIIDAKESTLQYASAGHPTPVHLVGAARQAEFLPAPGGTRAAIGIFEASEYQCLTRDFRAGDALLLYTDGLEEATDPAGEEFGPDRLLQVLHPLVGRPARDVTQGVMTALKQFTWSMVEQDDVCLIAIEGQSIATRIPLGLAHERLG